MKVYHIYNNVGKVITINEHFMRYPKKKCIVKNISLSITSTLAKSLFGLYMYMFTHIKASYEEESFGACQLF